MKLLRTTLLLVAASGCGPLAGGKDSASESGQDSEGSGESTDAIPTTCAFEDQLLESGESADTSDGCITYRCDQGALIVERDGRHDVPGDVELNDQADVDAQACVGRIDGGLTISGTAVDLTPLGQLTRVGGVLDISAADVVTLHGLENLSEIGAGLVIAHNQQLTTLAFQPFMSVFGDLTIDDNDALVSLAGAGFVGQCATCSIGEGEATTGTDEDPWGEGGDDDGSASAGADDTGPGGGMFYGNILVSNNDALTDISALRGLAFAWASVRLRGNAALNTIGSLQLVQVSGDLEISGHPSLADVDAQTYAGSIDVIGARIICGNAGGAPC